MSRHNCPLCQQAERVVASVAATSGIKWQQIDIDSDAELIARYGWDVPVLLWKQQVIMQHHFDHQSLSQKLAALPWS